MFFNKYYPLKSDNYRKGNKGKKVRNLSKKAKKIDLKNLTRRNREKSNIAIVTVEKLIII